MKKYPSYLYRVGNNAYYGALLEFAFRKGTDFSTVEKNKASSIQHYRERKGSDNKITPVEDITHRSDITNDRVTGMPTFNRTDKTERQEDMTEGNIKL